jgi:hypothetical protein
MGPNNSFKPTPHRGVNSVLCATLHAVATPPWGGLTQALGANVNCSQLYFGANKKIDEFRSDLFSVTLVPSGSTEAKNVRAALGSKYIYYLAPHTGCGCGWDFLDIDTPDDDLSRQSCEALSRFLKSIERGQKGGKIYSVCIDSIGVSARSETRLSAEEFMKGIDQLRVSYSSAGAKVYLVGT